MECLSLYAKKSLIAMVAVWVVWITLRKPKRDCCSLWARLESNTCRIVFKYALFCICIWSPMKSNICFCIWLSIFSNLYLIGYFFFLIFRYLYFLVYLKKNISQKIFSFTMILLNLHWNKGLTISLIKSICWALAYCPPQHLASDAQLFLVQHVKKVYTIDCMLCNRLDND